MIFMKLFACLLLLWSAAGCQPECAVSADCQLEQQCVNGTCQPFSLPLPDIGAEGEGEGFVAEGEGEVFVAEGEGEVFVAEGEGEFAAEGEGEFAAEGEGEGAAEGEGEGVVGEGEGEPPPCGGLCANDETCISNHCVFDGNVCGAAFENDVRTTGVSVSVDDSLTIADPFANFGVAGTSAQPRRIQRYNVDTSTISNRFGTDLLFDVQAEADFDCMAAAYDGACNELGGNDDNGGINRSTFTILNVARDAPIILMLGGFNDGDVGTYNLSIRPSLCGAVIENPLTYDQCARAFDANPTAMCGVNNPCARDSVGNTTGSVCCTLPGCGATAANPVSLVPVKTGCG
jgi:hypothetical protein